MPRRPRLELPGTPRHVIQRGVNRCAIFADEVDRQHYYDLICDAANTHGIVVHAHLFMGNDIHLLLTSPHPDAPSHAMRNTGRWYVHAFNRRHRRSGTLWQGRFKSCLVPDEIVYFNSGQFGVYFGLVRLQTSAAPTHRNGVWD